MEPSLLEQKVCLVTRQVAGRLLQREFQAPRLAPGERAIMHLSMTGHGWSDSTQQCGEFCEMLYHLSFDDTRVGNVNMWRADCQENPNSPQSGTWKYPRNGWCPGSVSSGVFLDVTDALPHDAGKHRVAIDVTVRDTETGEFKPYSNYGAEAGGDRATLLAALSLFVYDKASVNAILGQSQGYTPAEDAMRQAVQGKSTAFLQANTRQDDRLNFLARAPWYSFANDTQADRDLIAGAIRVPALGDGGVLQQSSTRVQTGKISRHAVPKSWSRVALHLRLSKPPGNLDFDHYDRIGSIGLLFPQPNGHVSHNKMTFSAPRELQLHAVSAS